MKKLNYKIKLHFTILYIVLIISIVTNVISNKNMILEDKTQIIKTMDKTTEVINLDKTIEELNASHTEYSNYIQTSKANLATAITNAGVTTNGDDTFETMIANVSNIVSNKTSDATATEAQILENKTAYVKGNKLIGTMPNNGELNWNPSTSTSYTVPAGFYSGGILNSSNAYNAGYNVGKKNGDPSITLYILPYEKSSSGMGEGVYVTIKKSNLISSLAWGNSAGSAVCQRNGSYGAMVWVTGWN